MASIYGKGYSDWKDVFSGLVDGEPKGLLPNLNPITAMGYEHHIDRLITVGSSLFGSVETQEGVTSIQIKNEDVIVFDQTILFGVQTLQEFGGLVSLWWPNLYGDFSNGKFKTRNIGGTFLSPIIEPYPTGISRPTFPESELPANPGVVYFHTQKQASITIRTPSLPERTDSFLLSINNTDGNRFGTYVILETVFGPNQDYVIDVSDHGPDIVEKTWVKLIGVNTHGTTTGEAVRDMWTHIAPDGLSLDSGYEGYKYIDPTFGKGFFAESAFTLNTGGEFSSFVLDVQLDLITPPYLFGNNIPVGSNLFVKSDYWVGTYLNDKAYFSISFRETSHPPKIIYDNKAGELWVFEQNNTGINNSRCRRLNRFQLSEDRNLVSENIYNGGLPIRAKPTIYYIAFRNTGADILVSLDEGRSWDTAMPIVEGVNPINNGSIETIDKSTILILSIATADDSKNNILIGNLLVSSTKFDIEKKAFVTEKHLCDGDTIPTTNFVGLFGYGTTYNLLVKDEDTIRFFVSTNGCVTWKEIL